MLYEAHNTLNLFCTLHLLIRRLHILLSYITYGSSLLLRRWRGARKSILLTPSTAIAVSTVDYCSINNSEKWYAEEISWSNPQYLHVFLSWPPFSSLASSWYDGDMNCSSHEFTTKYHIQSKVGHYKWIIHPDEYGLCFLLQTPSNLCQ